VITLHCCGEKYHADEQHVGRKVKCRKCGRVLTIEAVVPTQGASSVRRGPFSIAQDLGRQSLWHTATSRTTNPMVIAKIATGGVVLAGVLVWAIIAGLPDGKSKSAAKSLESPATVPTAVEPQLVTPPERPTVSLPNGTWLLKPHENRGHGVLRIQNGDDFDSTVRLVTASIPRKLFWVIYIRAHEEKTVSGIAAGTYLLRFALGRDWNADTRRFLQNVWFYEAGRQLDFTETTPTEERPGEYIKFHVTLNEVIGGNLPRVGITEAVFNEGESDN
jgi:hypothetical protein